MKISKNSPVELIYRLNRTESAKNLQFHFQSRKKGLVNEKFEKDYSFPYVMKLCREYKVCDFKTIKVGKKHIKNDKELTDDLSKKALMIISM